MAATDVQQPVQAGSTPSVPDYLADPDAVLKDATAKWRYGRAPDYSKTRKVYTETKQMNHETGSLEEMVENLVKNWEVEASFKPQLSDWRTVDHSNYTFAINGGPPQSAEHMLKVGTYNAIIAPSEYYSPDYSDFASSHKTFKRMMPTFAWEVLEVYSGPPKVAFKWRHWGTMKNDYVGFNNKGEKVTAKAHGGPIDITGITIATVDDKVRLQEVNTYFDPLEMFRQIAPSGIVNKAVVDQKVFATDKSAALDAPSHDGIKIADEHDQIQGDSNAAGNTDNKETSSDAAPACQFSGASMSATMSGCPMMNSSRPSNSSPESDWVKVSNPGAVYSSSVTGHPEERIGAESDTSKEANVYDAVDKHLEGPTEQVHPHPHDMEQAVKPKAGEAVAVEPQAQETELTYREMSNITKDEEPLLMNRE